MNFTRRDTLILGASAGAAAAMPSMGFAAGSAADAVSAFTGGAAATEGGVEIGAPEIAENGNTVPIEVSAEGAAEILLLADGNPSPGVARFSFGPLAVAAASTRIRLAGSQNIIAVAKMQDGSFRTASRAVKVTIGGCGG